MKEKKLRLDKLKVQSFITDVPDLVPEKLNGGCGSTQIFCTIVVKGGCCYTCDYRCDPKDDEETKDQ